MDAFVLATIYYLGCTRIEIYQQQLKAMVGQGDHVALRCRIHAHRPADIQPFEPLWWRSGIGSIDLQCLVAAEITDYSQTLTITEPGGQPITHIATFAKL